jgi:hypothetical protein
MVDLPSMNGKEHHGLQRTLVPHDHSFFAVLLVNVSALNRL